MLWRAYIRSNEKTGQIKSTCYFNNFIYLTDEERTFFQKDSQIWGGIWILVVIPQWQCVDDKLRIKTVCFRKRQIHCEEGDRDPLLKQVQLRIKYVLPGLQDRKESAAWRHSQSGPRRAPETDESRHSASSPQPCLLFSPISYSIQHSGRAMQILPLLWSEKRKWRLKNR